MQELLKVFYMLPILWRKLVPTKLLVNDFLVINMEKFEANLSMDN